jgi:7,8-dihydropterin-6-yl-methyl-4-(beta-D-ribofuranosyl)aminobenzene 5'-phosphate synthase
MAGASEAQVQRVIRELRDLGVERTGPCHCSGDRTRAIFKESYGDAFVAAGVGKRLHFAAAE